MDRLEFEILDFYAEKNDTSIKDLKIEGVSAELIANAEEDLEERGLIRNHYLTEYGWKALEPYKVKRAVFLAAGFGSRMAPITINTPKPLVKVRGKRIIETLLDAVLAADISEIYIVRGYLGEQFELLLKKYPMIRLIDNPEYDGTGTISSFFYARKLLKGAYVLESDLVVNNSAIVRKYQYSSGFMGTKMGATEDWYLKTDIKNTICEIGVGGEGDNLYKLIGISYWNEADGDKLAHDIEEAYYSPNGKQLPMSFVPFRVYKNQYQVSIMPCKEDDVIEIDSFSELQAYDEIYKIKTT